MRVIIIYKIDMKNQEQNNNKNHIVNFYTIFLLIIIIDKTIFRQPETAFNECSKIETKNRSNRTVFYCETLFRLPETTLSSASQYI